MSCPKCNGLLVSDDYGFHREVSSVRCVNCGLRILEGCPINFPPFQMAPCAAPPSLVLVTRKPLTEKQLAWRLYMQTYMRAYRAKQRRLNGAVVA